MSTFHLRQFISTSTKHTTKCTLLQFDLRLHQFNLLLNFQSPFLTVLYCLHSSVLILPFVAHQLLSTVFSRIHLVCTYIYIVGSLKNRSAGWNQSKRIFDRQFLEYWVFAEDSTQRIERSSKLLLEKLSQFQ